MIRRGPGERNLATLDDIVRERQRISERLARLDEERAQLREELVELDAAERVLTRLSRTPPGGASARRGFTEADVAEAVPARRGRRARAGPRPPGGGAPSLGDATLQAVKALGSDVSAAEVRDYLGREFGMQVRANHLGMALQRHRRAGRLAQHEKRWSLPGR